MCPEADNREDWLREAAGCPDPPLCRAWSWACPSQSGAGPCLPAVEERAFRLRHSGTEKGAARWETGLVGTRATNEEWDVLSWLLDSRPQNFTHPTPFPSRKLVDVLLEKMNQKQGRFVGNSHSDGYEVIPHCGFNLHFSDDEWHWASLHVCWPSVCPLWRTIYSETQNTSSKEYMHPYVHCSVIYSSHAVEATQVPKDEWIKKLWYTHTMEYYLAIKRMKSYQLWQHGWT